MSYLYPIRLQPSLHETIWGGRRLERDQWKTLPSNEVAIGESWETEVSNIVENGEYEGRTLGDLVKDLGEALLGEQAITIFGQRFPLLAKFIDANAQLSVQVHPKDTYAAQFENGKLGKTEFWYILAAEPDAKLVHGFKMSTNAAEAREAIEQVALDQLIHEESVQAGDIVFVPAGTVHAIGSGILLYELQEYSDVTYRMYDYGRLTASGQPRELHIERSLEVSHFYPSPQVKMHPVQLANTPDYEDRCLVACHYFVSRELRLKETNSAIVGTTGGSCIILTSLGAEVQVYYGEKLDQAETLSRGQTMILPAKLGTYRIQGSGNLLFSYVPGPTDEAKKVWTAQNPESAL
ncbi:MAG TPA: type I phosphomannose isomerase catalytic subunit [Dictyobacter sp.]|nr:type I phosphomannose isomerase catalytic subunit [Dictyobacter sp.]